MRAVVRILNWVGQEPPVECVEIETTSTFFVWVQSGSQDSCTKGFCACTQGSTKLSFTQGKQYDFCCFTKCTCP